MKRLIFFCLLLMSLPVFAQDDWRLNTELDESIELTEKYSIYASGFVMHYPDGWHIEPSDPVALFASEEEALLIASLDDIESGQVIGVIFPTVADLNEYPGEMEDNTAPSTIVSFYASMGFTTGYEQYAGMTVDEVEGREISASYATGGAHDRLVIAIENGDDISTVIAFAPVGEMQQHEAALVAMMNSFELVELPDCEAHDEFTDVTDVTDFDEVLTESYTDVFTGFSFLYPEGWVPCFDPGSGLTSLAITADVFNVDFNEYPEGNPAATFIPSMVDLGIYEGEMDAESVAVFWDELGRTQGVYQESSPIETFETDDLSAAFFTNSTPGHDRLIIIVETSDDDISVLMAFSASGEMDAYLAFYQALVGTITFEE